MLAQYLLVGLVAYLVGAIPVGLCVGWLVAGKDIRKEGSGKTGATNVARAVGWRAALAVFSLDVLKGTAAVLIGRALLGDSGADALALADVLTALAAVIGHNWPIYVGFRGGRGVAPGVGTVLAIVPLAFLCAIVLAAVLLITTDTASAASLIGTAFVVLVLASLLLTGQISQWYWIYTVTGATLIFGGHWDNIGRLLRGTERRLGVREKLLTRLRGG
ncbi:MAG: glycerol-3-phosphate 1-O-acyltransferase PlsY [Chloroflexi bacterium]|nr:glycerol-3-phosphate 1-O-acyltransferase PlsY [Chloroflexota bacterium]